MASVGMGVPQIITYSYLYTCTQLISEIVFTNHPLEFRAASRYIPYGRRSVARCLINGPKLSRVSGTRSHHPGLSGLSLKVFEICFQSWERTSTQLHSLIVSVGSIATTPGYSSSSITWA